MSSTDNKDPESLSLRDRFALEALNGILSKITISDAEWYLTNEKGKAVISNAVKLSYHIADKMREFRLKAFE